MSTHHSHPGHPHYSHRTGQNQSSMALMLPNNNPPTTSNASSTANNTTTDSSTTSNGNGNGNGNSNQPNNANSSSTNHTSNGTSSRIPELLECVKHEFENIHAESQMLKSQSQELENHITTCTSDLSHLRDQLFHLDREHQRLKTHYEEELRRLHLELDQQRSAAGGPSSHHHHDPRVPPNLAIASAAGSMNNFGTIVNPHAPNNQQQHNLNGHGSFHHESVSNFPPRDCEPPPSQNYSNGNPNTAPGGRNSTDNNLPLADHSTKRIRTDRDSRMITDNELDQSLRQQGPPPPIGGSHNPAPVGMAGSSGLPHPPGRLADSKNKLKPNDSQYSKLPSQGNSHPYGTSYHSRTDSHIPPPPSAPGHHHHHPGTNLPAGSGGGQITTSQSGPLQQQPPSSVSTNNPNNNTNVLLDLDPDTLPIHMKKEGPDWMTMFNPKVPKVLDVGLIHTLVHDSVVCCVKFSPDGTILATGCNRFTSLYNTLTGEKMCSLLDDTHGNKGADNYIRSASFSPDGKLLATGSEDRIIRIWDVSQRRIMKRFQGHKSEIYSLAFSPDGRILVSGSGDKTARIWDMTQGICLFHLLIEDTPRPPGSVAVDAGVTSVCVSPDGTLLAAGSLDTIVRLWDTTNGLLLDKLRGHQDSVYSVAFSPDGKFLVSGSLDKTLKLWDLSTLNRDGNPPFNSSMSVVNVKKEDQSSVSSNVGNGSGTTVGPGGVVNHHQAAVERGENGEKITSDRGFDPSRPSTLCTTTLTGHKDYVLSVAVSPDGEWIMSGSKDRGVQFWDPKTAMAQFMLQGHKNSVISIAVSETGGLLATGSGDWHARVWSYKRVTPKK